MGAKFKTHHPLLLSLGLQSASIIAFQLTLMQLLSIAQWHHFAYMIISVAMLGFGASGTLLALARKWLTARAEWLIPLLMTISGIWMMFAFRLARTEIFRFDIYLLFVDYSQFPILAINYIIYFLPFFTGALAIGMLFIIHTRDIGKYYFSNLLGSGMGGLLALFLFFILTPQQIPPLAGLLSVMAGLLGMGKRFKKMHIALGIAACCMAIFFIARPGTIPVSQYKGIARALNLPDAEVVYRQPHSHGLIEVVSSPALRYAPALSLSYTGQVPVKKHIFVNGDYAGVVPKYKSGQEDHILNYSTQALPWVLGKHDRVLMLNAAEGATLSQIFTKNPLHVDAIIPNAGIIDALREKFSSESADLIAHENLHIHHIEGRNFLASTHLAPFDLILLPLQDAFGGTSGVNALQENYMLTQEAFGSMWQNLSNDGVISISSWIDYPPRTSLKILATLVGTMTEHSPHDPSDHIVAVRSWGTITFMVKKSPFTKGEMANIREFCQTMYFDPLLMPDLEIGERDHFNKLDDGSFFNYIDRIMAFDEAFMEEYTFMIYPAIDDKPYFSQFLKPGTFRELSRTFGADQFPFLELGYLIVLVTLLQSALLAFVFIIMPLLRLKKKSREGKMATVLYFGALGIGYMFVEIILIQRFVLYFGQAVYAISAVISTMLIFSGAGSLVSGRLRPTLNNMTINGLIVAGMLSLYVAFLTSWLQYTIAAPLGVKILISLLIIGIPSFFKGMMFPLGIRHLAGYDIRQVPWAWGINGSFSVVSTSLAMLIAVEAGFRMVLSVAVICYVLASMVWVLHKLVIMKRNNRENIL